MKRFVLALLALLTISTAYAVSLKEVRETYWKAGPLIQPVVFTLVPAASGTSSEYSIATPPGGIIGTTFSASKETPIYNPGTIGNYVCSANPNADTGNITCAVWKNGVSQLSCVVAVSTTQYQRCTVSGTFNVARGDLLTLVYTTTQASWNSTVVQTGYTITSSTGQNGNIFFTGGTLATGAGGTNYFGPNFGQGTTEVSVTGFSPSAFWITGITVKLSGNDGAAGSNRSYYVCHNATSTPAGCTTSTITCTTTSSSICTSSSSAAPILVQPTDTFSISVVATSGAPATNTNMTLGIQPVIPGQYPAFGGVSANAFTTSWTSTQGTELSSVAEPSAWNALPKTSSLTYSNLYVFFFNALATGNSRTVTIKTGPYAATSPTTSNTTLSCVANANSTSPQGGGGNLVGIGCHNKGQVPAVTSGYSSVSQVSTIGVDNGGQRISYVMVAH